MNKMYSNLILIIFFYLNSLCAADQKMPMFNSQIVYQELSIPAMKLAEKYNLHFRGHAVAMPGGDIKSVGLTFQRRGDLSKNEARVLLISIVQDFISELKLLKHLGKHPFGIHNTEITIFIVDSEGKKLDDPNLAVIEIASGNLSFVTMSTVDGYRRIKTDVVETYGEALKEIGSEPPKCET